MITSERLSENESRMFVKIIVLQKRKWITFGGGASGENVVVGIVLGSCFFVQGLKTQHVLKMILKFCGQVLNYSGDLNSEHLNSRKI